MLKGPYALTVKQGASIYIKMRLMLPQIWKTVQFTVICISEMSMLRGPSALCYLILGKGCRPQRYIGSITTFNALRPFCTNSEPGGFHLYKIRPMLPHVWKRVQSTVICISQISMLLGPSALTVRLILLKNYGHFTIWVVKCQL